MAPIPGRAASPVKSARGSPAPEPQLEAATGAATLAHSSEADEASPEQQQERVNEGSLETIDENPSVAHIATSFPPLKSAKGTITFSEMTWTTEGSAAFKKFLNYDRYGPAQHRIFKETTTYGNVVYAKIDGTEVGCFSYIPKDQAMHLTWAAVGLKYEGLGLGSYLMSLAVRICIELGLTAIISAKVDEHAPVAAIWRHLCTRTSTDERYTHVLFPIKESMVCFLKTDSKGRLLPPGPALPDCLASGAVSLRVAEENDLKPWRQLVLEACNYEFGGTDICGVSWKADYRLVAYEEVTGTLVGMAAVKQSGWVPFIAVSKQCRGTGLGSYMLHVLMDWLQEIGRSEMTLSPLNSKVMAFYRQWGFTATAQKKGRTFDTCDYIMSRDLPSERVLPSDAARPR